jgi:hypothetical protein
MAESSCIRKQKIRSFRMHRQPKPPDNPFAFREDDTCRIAPPSFRVLSNEPSCRLQ